MIDLHERLSEYSYGFGATREALSLFESIGLKPTPFLPSLLHEEELGFDVGFKDRGRVVVLQFKLGHELRRFHRKTPSQAIPPLARPFWRFNIDTSAHQFQRLTEFEDSGADTYYVAPKFSSWQDFDTAFQAGKILERSLLQKPSEISAAIFAQGGNAGQHRVVYDDHAQFVCSEPTRLPTRDAKELGREIETNVRQSPASLEANLKLLFERQRPSVGPGPFSAARRDQILRRFKDPLIGIAAAVGLEAWSQGGQLILVTEAD
ncbi:hypothetical protein GOD71_30610 [Sinorhizobium medicae]|nr:hypothetical protein [Sinorhizobium medicae]MDX0506472.1 hypothetical protein [Sinorhizobium medicae]MDX0592907.1 hypothetical protein [Sinorhizobium medicae]MDX0648949.1 hypothetical protein [Sinorhizobium medicae]MDX0741790.1 hypothetical protein [Sinorhizobium medicae]